MAFILDSDWEKIEKKYEDVIPKGQFDDRLIAMANTLAKRQVKWSVFERKLFFLTISQLRFTTFNNPTKVIMKKKDIYEKLGLSGLSLPGGYLKDQFKEMQKKSYVSWEDESDPDEIWEGGHLISHVKASKHEILVTLNEEFMPLLENLSERYTTMLLDDLVSFDSRHAMTLYMELKRIYDSRFLWNEKDFTTAQLKKIFGMSENDYVKSNGKFDRFNFEKKTIQTAINEINEKSEMMQIQKWWKVKKGNSIKCYVFRYGCKQAKSLNIEYIELNPDLKRPEPPEGQLAMFEDI